MMSAFYFIFYLPLIYLFFLSFSIICVYFGVIPDILLLLCIMTYFSTTEEVLTEKSPKESKWLSEAKHGLSMVLLISHAYYRSLQETLNKCKQGHCFQSTSTFRRKHDRALPILSPCAFHCLSENIKHCFSAPFMVELLWSTS